MGIGGSVDAGSQSDRVLRAVLTAVTDLGAEVEVFSGRDLDLPPYHSGADVAGGRARLRRGGPPGRRAGDHLARLPRHRVRPGEERPGLPGGAARRPAALPGRACGRLVAVARGWQASVATLGTLRQVVHALRGWPTPLGLAINSSVTTFDEHGHTDDASTAAAVRVMAGQLVDFAQRGARRTRSTDCGRQSADRGVRRGPGDILGCRCRRCAPGERTDDDGAPTRPPRNCARPGISCSSTARTTHGAVEGSTGRGRAPSTGVSSGSTSSPRNVRTSPHW